MRITGPNAVPDITQTFDPDNPPNPYEVTSSGPADPNDPTSYLSRGPYTVSITGTTATGATVQSKDDDPNKTISLVEVVKVDLKCRPSSTWAATGPGTKVSDEQMATLNIRPQGFHGDWNYTIRPRATSEPRALGAENKDVR